MVQRLLTVVLSMFVTCHGFIYNLIRAPWTGLTFSAPVLARLPKDFQVITIIIIMK